MDIWILFLVMQSPFYDARTISTHAQHGSTITTQEFNSQNSCVNAGNAMIKLFKDKENQGNILAANCLPK